MDVLYYDVIILKSQAISKYILFLDKVYAEFFIFFAKRFVNYRTDFINKYWEPNLFYLLKVESVF